MKLSNVDERVRQCAFSRHHLVTYVRKFWPSIVTQTVYIRNFQSSE